MERYMLNSHSTKNYFAHGGNELVIGGKLTFLSGATVEGGEGLFDNLGGDAKATIPHLPDSEATNVASLRADFNALLAALRAAGIMETLANDEGGGG